MNEKQLEKIYREEFAVFILSHGRAKEMTTVNMLKRYKYTGKYFIVLDNEDEQIKDYIRRYGKNNIIVFDKKKIEQSMDTGDNGGSLKCGVFARNFIIDEADKMGYKYHLQLDDDYNGYCFRYVKDGRLRSSKVTDLDKFFKESLRYLINGDLDCLGYGVASDYTGGINSKVMKGFCRKSMNTFFLRADRKFYFVARMNDDVTTNLVNNKIGKKIITVLYAMVSMPATQRMKGGMTDVYTDEGTYMKSFYSVMFEPSACKVDATMKKVKRVHHSITWNNISPKILNERYKK